MMLTLIMHGIGFCLLLPAPCTRIHTRMHTDTRLTLYHTHKTSGLLHHSARVHFGDSSTSSWTPEDNYNTQNNEWQACAASEILMQLPTLPSRSQQHCGSWRRGGRSPPSWGGWLGDGSAQHLQDAPVFKKKNVSITIMYKLFTCMFNIVSRCLTNGILIKFLHWRWLKNLQQ